MIYRLLGQIGAWLTYRRYAIDAYATLRDETRQH